MVLGLGHLSCTERNKLLLIFISILKNKCLNTNKHSMKTLHFKTFELALWEWSVRSLKPPKKQKQKQNKKKQTPIQP